MKKQWNNPVVSNLGVASTESISPIISSTLISGGMKPMYSWLCPCCGETSGHVFNTQEEADTQFYSIHLVTCSKYSLANDACLIS